MIPVGVYAPGDGAGLSKHLFDSAHTSDLIGKERYTTFIANYDSGTGDGSVPASTYALGVSTIKAGWQNTTRPGQAHGLSIVTRGGFHGAHSGPSWYNPGDSTAIVTNSAVSSAQSYVSAAEGLVVYTKDGEYVLNPSDPVRQIRYYLPSIRAVDNPGIGHLVVAEAGPLGAAYQAQNRIDLPIGPGSWSHFLRYICQFGAGFYDAFLVNQLGHATWNNGPADPVPNMRKTVRVGGCGDFEIVNSAGTAVIHSITDTGSICLPAGQGIYVGSKRVVGSPQPGWGLDSGPRRRSGIHTASVTLEQLAQVVAAMKDDLKLSGVFDE